MVPVWSQSAKEIRNSVPLDELEEWLFANGSSYTVVPEEDVLRVHCAMSSEKVYVKDAATGKVHHAKWAKVIRHFGDYESVKQADHSRRITLVNESEAKSRVGAQSLTQAQWDAARNFPKWRGWKKTDFRGAELTAHMTELRENKRQKEREKEQKRQKEDEQRKKEDEQRKKEEEAKMAAEKKGLHNNAAFFDAFLKKKRPEMDALTTQKYNELKKAVEAYESEYGFLATEHSTFNLTNFQAGECSTEGQSCTADLN